MKNHQIEISTFFPRLRIEETDQSDFKPGPIKQPQ